MRIEVIPRSQTPTLGHSRDNIEPRTPTAVSHEFPIRTNPHHGQNRERTYPLPHNCWSNRIRSVTETTAADWIIAHAPYFPQAAHGEPRLSEQDMNTLRTIDQFHANGLSNEEIGQRLEAGELVMAIIEPVPREKRWTTEDSGEYRYLHKPLPPLLPTVDIVRRGRIM